MAARQDPMMDELKACRRKLSLRLAKAEREGRLLGEVRKIGRAAMKRFRAEVAAIRRQDAATRRRNTVARAPVAAPRKTGGRAARRGRKQA